MIVNAIGFVLLTITITAGIALYDVASFVLDSKNAESFMDKLEAVADRLKYFGEDTSFTVEADAANEWTLEKAGNFLQLKIKGKTMKHEIKSALQNTQSSSEIILKGHSKLIVRKNKGLVEIEKA